MEPPPDALRAFRRSLYECLHRRGDALFELTDAILSTDASAPSPVHLSLQPAHRRGWGSFYAALTRGRIDAEALRKLLARHPLAGAVVGEPPVYAVDVSVWPRCDAECSPERGYYYHPSRHSAGQPIVAGWAYQFVAELNFVRESWTAPVDVERVRPAQDANVVASEQVKSFLGRRFSCEEGSAASPLFVFDAGYDPVKVQQGLEGRPCQILVRLRAGRRFYGDPSLCDPPAHVDALAAERRVVTFDNVGVGGTTGATPNTVEAMAHDAIAFIEALSLQRVDLLGFSIGSFVAQEIALIRPDLMRRVVLTSSAPQGAAGMHGWAPEVIGAVGAPETSPQGYLSVFRAHQHEPGRRAARHRAHLRENELPGRTNDMADSPGAIRRRVRVGHPQPLAA